MIDDEVDDPLPLGYPRSVAFTWLTTHRQLPAESALVFDALCWLSPEPIPERLVTQPWSAEMLAEVFLSRYANASASGTADR